MKNAKVAKVAKVSIVPLVVSLGLGGVLVGCSSGDAGAGGGAASDEAVIAESSSNSAFSDWAAVAAAFDASALDLEYSNRDLDASYDEGAATKISLSGDGVSVDGTGASADGACVTITEAGTYIVSGELADGQLVVDADDAKVQVVLAGAAIHNEDGPAIYVRQAGKCFITLADGTTNMLTDGSEYALEEDSDEPYATLFCRDDLTLNGSGTLVVTSSYRHAVCSKDDLVITGGTYIVDAVEDGLRGRDCVKIAGGNFTITAGGDGIKSNNDTDAMRGFVSIDDGTFDIDAGDKGVQAETYVRVAGGTFDVAADDDAFHSNLEMLVAGGDLAVSAGDDAFHAETELTVDDGVVSVASCYEGYEAEKIYVNGGETHIVASDDAINASAADLSSDDSSQETQEASASADGQNPPEMPDGAQDGAPGENGGFRGAGGMAAGDENCLIQINGGYIVLDAAGDGVDSNGSVEINGGVLLVSGPASGGDGAFDYDLEAVVTGGTVVMVGSTGMAQNFTSGTQPFAMTTVSGNAGESVAVVDESGNVVASLTASKQFGMVLVSSPAFEEGEAYSLVIGGQVSGANADDYTNSGTVTGGSATEITVSTTATATGMGAPGGGRGPGAAGAGSAEPGSGNMFGGRGDASR